LLPAHDGGSGNLVVELGVLALEGKFCPRRGELRQSRGDVGEGENTPVEVGVSGVSLVAVLELVQEGKLAGAVAKVFPGLKEGAVQRVPLNFRMPGGTCFAHEDPIHNDVGKRPLEFLWKRGEHISQEEGEHTCREGHDGLSIARPQHCGVDGDERPDQELNKHLPDRSRCRKERLDDYADLEIELMVEQDEQEEGPVKGRKLALDIVGNGERRNVGDRQRNMALDEAVGEDADVCHPGKTVGGRMSAW
jgi:hypothetical protein